MASFHQLPSGLWRAQVARAGVRKSATFPERAAAEEWARRSETSILSRHRIKQSLADSTLLGALPRRTLEALGKVAHSHDEVVKNAIPADKMTGVYFLIKDGRIVYVGQSIDVFTRISRHRNAGRDFDAFNVVACDPARMDEVEAAYIAALLPAMNNSLGNT